MENLIVDNLQEAAQAFNTTDNSEENGATDSTDFTDNQSTWLYAEGIPGNGEKPEWFNHETFKDITAQAKSYNELRKKLGAAAQGAPESYAINAESLGEEYKDWNLDTKDPLLENFTKIAHKHNIPQDFVNDVLRIYIDNDKNLTKENEETLKKYYQEELEKIGPNAVEDIKNLTILYKNNFLDSKLSDEQMEAEIQEFKNNLKDYSYYKFIDKIIRKASSSSRIPSQIPAETQKNLQDLKIKAREMQADKEKMRDPEYANSVHELYLEAHPELLAKPNPIARGKAFAGGV